MPKQSKPTDSANQPDRVPANLRRRLLAMVYDLILVFALVFCAAMIYAAIAKQISAETSANPTSSHDTGEVIYELEPIDLGWGFMPFCGAVAASFYVYFWRRTGQTLGMRAWKLKLESADGQAPPSYGSLLLRLVSALVSFAAAGIGYWYALFNADKASLHDKISGTWVSMPKQP